METTEAVDRPEERGAGAGGACEARAVLERLARIERLDREGASAGALLDELRLLLREAEAWTAAEGGEAGDEAVARLRSALAHDMIAV